MTLRPARLEFILVAVFFLGWAIASGLCLPSFQRNGFPDRVTTLYAVGFVAFPALLAAFFLLVLHPSAAYLKLEEAGFTFCTFFRPRTFKWEGVSSFQVKKVLFLEQVTFRMGSSRHRLFRDRCFPYTYGKKPEALAALLNEWRCHAIGQTDSSGEDLPQCASPRVESEQ